jgi:hypothetical protein
MLMGRKALIWSAFRPINIRGVVEGTPDAEKGSREAREVTLPCAFHIASPDEFALIRAIRG